MKRNWTNACIADLAVKVGSGATPLGGETAYKKTGTPLIRSMNVVFFGFKRNGLAYLDEQQAAALDGASVRANDVLLNITGASIGRVTLTPSDLDGARVNQHVCIIRPNPCIDARYLNAYLSSPTIQTRIWADNTGTTRQALTKQQILGFEVPLPPLAEQKRIADKLDTVLTRVDAVNTRLARVAPILKRFRQSVLTAATSGRLTEDWRVAQVGLGDAEELMTTLAMDHDEIGGHERGNASEPTKEAHDLSSDQLPDCWRIGTLKDCCTPGRPICYGILKPGPELEEGIPYIRVADFPGNRLSLAGIKRTSPEIDLQFKRARLKAGDLLLSIRGSVGRLIEIPASLEGANITQDTARLSISQRLNSKYIYLALLAPDTQRRMTSAIRGVAVRGINIGDVRALQVPIPTLAEQGEIVRRVETLFAFADRLEARLQVARTATERLTPALLAKAFRGELVPQDPNDEPASELLKRLASGSATLAPKRGRKKATGTAA